jgi:hypothetical protein
MSDKASWPAEPAWRLRPSLRRIVVRLAEAVCPPQTGAGDLMGGLAAEFEAMLGALPAGVRRLVSAGLVVFDQGARLYPRARGLRFVRLPDDAADAYFRAVLARRRGGLATSLQRIKALIVMCYYELPEVQEQLGYEPQPYIIEVSRRRLSSYGAQIRAGEAASLEPDPRGSGPTAPAGPPGGGS